MSSTKKIKLKIMSSADERSSGDELIKWVQIWTLSLEVTSLDDELTKWVQLWTQNSEVMSLDNEFTKRV